MKAQVGVCKSRRKTKGYLKSPPCHVGDIGRNNTIRKTFGDNIGCNESEDFMERVVARVVEVEPDRAE